MLNNIVDNLEKCGQHNIVQCCFHQARTGCSFLAVYAKCFRPSSYDNGPCAHDIQLNGLEMVTALNF